AGEMVRWYVTASDTAGIESRAPRFLDPIDSAEYFGTVVADPLITTDLPLMQWYVADPAAASTNAGARGSLFFNGVFYDNIQTDSHGQSTRGSAFPKKSFDFDANKGEKFLIQPGVEPASDFNLLSNYADQTKLRNSLTYDLFAQAGYPSHLAFSVMVYRNGSLYGLYDLVEEGDTEFLDRVGLDSNNPLYKVNNRLNDAYTNVEKKSREYEDHSDFQEVVTAAQSLSGTAALDWDFDNLDMADIVNYLAVHNVTVSNDFGHKNMYWYRDTTGTGLWSALPWDQDLSLGHVWDASVSPSYFRDDLVTDRGVTVGANNVFQRLYQDSTFREMYMRRVRTLTDQFYGAVGTPVLDSYLATRIQTLEPLIADEAIEDANLWGIQANFTRTPAQAAQQLVDEFIPLRRAHIDGIADVPDAHAVSPTVLFDVNDYDADPVSGLQSEEYVRLNNPNLFAVDISGWQITEGISHTFKGGTVIPAGGTLYVVKDVTAFRSRTSGPSGGQRLVMQGNYEGQLTFTGETIRLLDAQGLEKDTLTTPATIPTTNQEFLRVTEINYNPAQGDTEFIEFANISDSVTLDLGGVTITDGPRDPFVFATATSLAPGQRILVGESTADLLSHYPLLDASMIAGQYTGGLSNSGEKIKVVDAGGQTIFDVDYGDSDPWPFAADGDGVTLELIDEVGTPMDQFDKYYHWRASVAVGGTPGFAPLPPSGVVINEILAHTDAPLVDSVELHNPTAAAIDISGWFLSDKGDDLQKFQIPLDTIISPGGFLVFDELDFNPSSGSQGTSAFALDAANGDQVWLSRSQGLSVGGQVEDAVDFTGTLNGQSLGRVPDGSGRLSRLAQRSLGVTNGPAMTGRLVVSEVHYHPADPSAAAIAALASVTADDLEFVEIQNPTPHSVDVSGWTLAGIADLDLPTITLAAGATIVAVSFDPADAGLVAAFEAEFGVSGINLVGPWSGGLSNNFGRVTLRQPDSPPVDQPTVVPEILIDEVVYDDLVPWPTAADGDGVSLHRIAATAYGNSPQSWQAAIPTPGTATLSIAAPVIVEMIRDQGDVSRPDLLNQLAVTFDVDVTISADALALHNDTGGTFADISQATFTYDAATRTATWDFAALPQPLEAAFYTVNFNSNRVTATATEVTMAGGTAIPVYVAIPGDANLDGDVDTSDFDFGTFTENGDESIVGANLGTTSGATWAMGDFNGDGDVDVSQFDFATFTDVGDLATLKANLGRNVVPATGPAPSLVLFDSTPVDQAINQIAQAQAEAMQREMAAAETLQGERAAAEAMQRQAAEAAAVAAADAASRQEAEAAEREAARQEAEERESQAAIRMARRMERSRLRSSSRRRWWTA
ncbi:MAG: lamin tail domain-containing protein, partial [Rubripirellula sp.]